MFQWNIPTKVLFGPGMIKNLAKEKMPGKKALVLTSNGTSARKNGSFDGVIAALDEQEIPYAVFPKIEANPVETTLMEGVLFARENQCDFVIGIGGGSVLDAATVIAGVAPQPEGRVWDYIRWGSGGKMRMTKPSLPYIAVTTSAGTGSEVDTTGVVTNEKTNEKTAFTGAFPTLAVVDPELMVTVPPAFTAYQGFDALLHNAEVYVSRFANEMSDMIALEGVRSVAGYLARAVSDGTDIEARTKVAFGNLMGGYAMEVSALVSEHSLEHAMSAYHPKLPHGAGLIMICEAYFEALLNKHAADERMIALARAMGKTHAKEPEEFICAVRELKTACGVDDLKMSDYGIKPEEFATLAENARSTMRMLYSCDRARFTDEDMVQILEKSYR